MTDGQGERVGPVCRRIQDVIAAFRPSVSDGAVAGVLDATAARLRDDQLRIAIGGRLKAGKSTLINALVGQQVAPTGAAECTKLVAWFRAGDLNRVEVRLVNGGSRYVSGKPGGGVPDDLSALGAVPEEIREIVVEVVNDRLAGQYTIVDTPGMDALSGLDDIAMGALAQADALLYVMPHPGEGDVAALEELRRQASSSLTAVNVLGVLSRVDELGDGVTKPWEHAKQLVDNYSAKLSGLMATIVPVIGLLAETAVGDEFTERDTKLVARLADTVGRDPVGFRNAIYSQKTFRNWESGPLSAAERERLLHLLGRHGLDMAVHAYGQGATGTVMLLAELRRRSGIDELLAFIDTRFVPAADRLRAASALAALDGVCATCPAQPRAREALAVLRARLAELRRHPLLRQVELGAALADLAAGQLELTAPQADWLLALATGNGAAQCLGLPPDASKRQIADAADAQVRQWRVLEHRKFLVTSHHARTAREFCEMLYFHNTGG